ncbi:MAG TPA: hypothetical protein VNL94_03525 [Candidatus Binatia bacterium]|nr:hypothetical protein [Candidatus Binatia bacterium]
MIASMFNLDQRLAELRPTEAELRLARERREAAEAVEAAGRGLAVAIATPDCRAAGATARPTRIAVG